MTRLGGHGIDLDRPVRFSFDGRPVQGFAGDTVASALLASGRRMLARSFKYHRPRGVVAAGSDEPSALVTLGRGAGKTPNVRASVQEIFEGLEVFSQNCWPSLRLDISALADLAAPFLGAGFYYKTFMWPPAFWYRLYEPLIRRAAGLGALSGEADRGCDEKAYAFCELLVVGGGPAGLMAALTAARAGVDVILVDEEPEFGGRLLGEAEQIEGQPAVDWVAAVIAELAAWPNVRLLPRTTVLACYDHGVYAALERVSTHLPGCGPDRVRECFWRIVASQVILASGANERMIAFAGNDRPGVMQAGAVRRYLHRYGVRVGRDVVVFANNDAAQRTAIDLANVGARVTVVDVRPEAKPLGDYAFYAGAQVIGTRGRSALRAVEVLSASGKLRLAADCLAVSGGWNPAVQLSCHLGAKPIWNEAIASFVPAAAAVPGMQAAGAVTGAFSTRDALATGIEAAMQAAQALGYALKRPDIPDCESDPGGFAPFWQVTASKGRAFVDLGNDVTTKDLQQAAREGLGAAEHAKRYTTQGMAADQGRGSNVNALAVLADATGRTLADIGVTTSRPPFVPVAISAMGAGGLGKGFAPVRLTPAHRANLENGAVMIEAGAWMRASHYLRRSESGWAEACAREVRAVRATVGVADVSSLSRFEIQGRDAGALLDFVCTSRVSALPPLRARYAVMLREDGLVMEDGPVLRLGPQRWWLSASSGAATALRRHLAVAHQGQHPEWEVSVEEVSEHWAQFAIAGPRAADLLVGLLDQMPDLPFMALAQVRLMGVAGVLVRISFSGELGYELALPARYGNAAMRALVEQAEALGGAAYGLEAMNVLRIEKGFVTHSEIDGRVSADDLGLGHLLRPDGGYIGAELAQRPALRASGRRQLVGLRPVEAGVALAAGGHLFAPEADLLPQNDLGHITSACHSPSLGGAIGLALLHDGRARIGQRLRLWDGVRGTDLACVVTSPTFYDPKGGRARGKPD